MILIEMLDLINFYDVLIFELIYK